MPVPASNAPPKSRDKQSNKSRKPETTSQTQPTGEQPAPTSWKSLFVFTDKKDIPLLAGAALCSIIASVAGPAQALITGKVFDGFVKFASRNIDADTLVDQQRKWILILVGIACASWVFHALEFAAWMSFGELQAKNARSQLFQGLSKMDIAWYDMCDDGIQAHLSRSQSHIKDLQLATSQPLGGILSLVSTSLIALGQALYNSWDLTLVTLAGAPLIAAVIVCFGFGMQKAIDKQQTSRGAAQRRSLEALFNIETVKCFNAQETECEHYLADITNAAYWYRKIVHNNALQMACLGFLVQAMFVQAFYYGGVLIRNGKKESSQVITTFFSAITAFQAIQGIIPQMVVLEKGRFASVTLRRLIPSTATSGVEDGAQYKPFDCKGNIQLKSVCFSYPSRPEQLALDNVSLVLPGGALTFLVGRSGSGKSTIGQLLVRFYDLGSGTVLLDGEDLHGFNMPWLRSHITLVEQMSTLFEGSISENIALGSQGDRTHTKQDMDAAMEFALLQGMINDMPDGLNTALDQRGDSVSGGQRQRIALARARLRNTAILILDESTSALDQISRELMMDAIRQWRKDKTTIIVTHDIAQIRAEDYAIVLEHGKVVQEGYRQHMEAVPGSPFSNFLAGPGSPIHFSARSSPPPMQYRPSERPTSFFSAASVHIDTLPFHGFRMSSFQDARSKLVHPVFRGARSDNDAVPSGRPRLDDNRTISQRMQDFVQETGQWALANRRPSAHRRPVDAKRCIEFDSVKQADVQTAQQPNPSLLQMLDMMRHELPLTTQLILSIGYLAGTMHAACSPIFAYVLAKLLALYSRPGDTSHLSLAYSLAILGIAGADATMIFLYRFLIETVSQTWVDNLRRQAVQRLLDQPLEFFESTDNTANLLAETLDHHAEEMRNLFGRFIVMLHCATVILLISFIWAVSTQWKMTLIAITAAPYIFVVASSYTKISEKWEILSNDASNKVNTVLNEAFGKVRTVRSLALESHFHNRFIDAIECTLMIGYRRALLSGFFYGMSNSAGVLATALVFYVGTRLVHDGTSVSSVVQVFTILIITISNVSAILDYVPQIGSAKEMALRVLRLARLPETSHERQGDTRILTVGRVEFAMLDFAYPGRPEALVLKDATFEVRPGFTTAIVGGSGSGKSTVAKLLLKLYPTTTTSEPNKHQGLTICGRAIERIDTKALRRVTAVVAQTSALFGASIRENIVYGLSARSEQASMDNVIKASKQAGIHDFVSSLPDGYDTLIGPGGMGLSGGQVQRIAIARALARSPSLLILDEATSALDTASAALVRETIHELVRSRDHNMTIIMITHNREMMEVAEHVVVLDHGCVVETGRYETLAKCGGHLTNLLKGGAIE